MLVTHDQQEALSLADQVAVLRGGRIAQVGTPQELYEQPVDAAMAQFVGDANLLDATQVGTRVETPLGVVEARASAEGRVVALLRPEQLRLLDASVAESSHDDSAGGAGVPATVVERTFHGHDTLLTLRLEVSGASDTVRARVAGGSAPAPGSGVRLAATGPVTTFPTPR